LKSAGESSTHSRMDFVAFDLETTGIDSETDEILEIGAVKFSCFEPVDTFVTLVNPGRSIPLDAEMVHGISDEMVQDAKGIKEVFGPFADFCGDLPMVAHNARFDFKFLETAIKKHKGKAPTGVILDSFNLAKTVIRGLPNYKLETLILHFNFPSTVFHRAEADAAYCGMVFGKIIQVLEAGHHPTAIHDLLQLSEMKELRLPQVAQQSEQLGLF
jgi:DNA polymerase III subunit epsilon